MYLKSCPFCASTSVKVLSRRTRIFRNDFGDFVEYRIFSVRCNYCNARGPAIGGLCSYSDRQIRLYDKEILVYSYNYYRYKVSELWNKRF